MFNFFILFTMANYVGSSVLVKSSSDYKVELIIAMFRHGDRKPVLEETYPLDPYKSLTFGPNEDGELTNKGKEREYRIGKMLRKHYGDFLGKIYKSENVESYSTNLDRTIMSLQLALAGLFPPTPEQIWNKDVYWSPAVIRNKPQEFDFLQIFEGCFEYKAIWNEILDISTVQDELNKHKDIIKYISKFSGLPENIYFMSILYNLIQSQMSLGLERPEWYTEEVMHKLKKLMELEGKLFVYTNDAKQLLTGPIIKSTSDIHLHILLHGHNLTFPLVNYGDTVILEKLRGDDYQIYIRFLYWSSTDDKLMVLKLNDCDKICPLSKYIKIVKPILPLGDGTECLYKNNQKYFKSWMDGTLDETQHANRFNKIICDGFDRVNRAKQQMSITV